MLSMVWGLIFGFRQQFSGLGCSGLLLGIYSKLVLQCVRKQRVICYVFFVFTGLHVLNNSNSFLI